MPAAADIAERLRQAVARHQAGDQGGAARLYAEVLALAPGQPDALHLSGVLAFQQGRHDEAIDLITRAMQAAPRVAAYAHSRGTARRARGDLAGAEADFAGAARLDPRHTAAWLALGQVRLARGHSRDALAAFRRALSLAPDAAEVHAYLGTALLRQDDVAGAVAALRRAVALDAHMAEAHYNLGIALERQGDDTAAERAWRAAIESNPFYLKPWNHLALLLQRRGRAGEARALLERALAQSDAKTPEAATLWNSLGNLLEETNEVEASLDAYARAVALAPDEPGLRLNRGSALLAVGLNDEAQAEIERARHLAPTLGDAAHAAFFVSLYTRDAKNPPREAMRAWAQALPRERQAPPRRERDPERRLRLGYVSPDFFRHSVAYFIEPVLAAHDRSAVEVFAYANVRTPDSTTQRLREIVDHWRDVRSLRDDQLAARVREDRIDVLIDLAGHTVGTRLAAFAQRPAPIQATWIGYPGTTGLPEIDWRITDAWADPPGLTETQFSERLLRLPTGFNAYRPPERSPDVAPLPAERHGHVTFGSFNFGGKLNPALYDRWAAILRHVPDSRLIVKHRGLAVGRVRDGLANAFRERGIDSARLDLMAFLADPQGHLAVYNRVDIALDSFPYNGTTTTCEALWMGVPVVTQAGDSHMSRVGVSLLTRAGLADWIAANGEAYVDLACRQAADLPALARLRAGLRERLRVSPLCDAVAVTRTLEAALRGLWREWCAAKS